MKQRIFWIFLNFYGWLIFGMSIITAFIVNAWWVVLIGVIGYQVVLLLEMLVGRYMGKSGAVQLSTLKQENRELLAEQARLFGAIETRDERIKQLEALLPDRALESVAPVEQIAPTAQQASVDKINEGRPGNGETLDIPSPDGTEEE